MRVHAVAVAVGLLFTVAASGQELAEQGKPAPMFRLPVYNPDAIGGSTVLGIDKYIGPDSGDQKAKLVLLSFMASFCAPCKKEMPFLQSLNERYGPLGLRVLSVSIDTEEDGQKKISELIAQNHVTYPVLKDRFNLVARRWLGLKSPLPSVFLVKTDGEVVEVHRGYSDDVVAQLEGEVTTKLGVQPIARKAPEPPPAAEVVPAATTEKAQATPAKATAQAKSSGKKSRKKTP